MNAHRRPKIAIVHDWLTSPGGAERVLQQMLIVFPDADLFAICDFLDESHRHLLMGRVPKTSFIQKLPFARTKHFLYLPLMPLAIEQFDMSSYDIVVSSSYSVAKGVLTGPGQTHLSYIYTPIRYAWHLQHQYLAEMNLTRGIRSGLARLVLHYMRIWDLRSAVGVDFFVGISQYVAMQISRQYKQKCSVLHPPVDLQRFTLELEKDGYYVTASRLVPYKRVDLIVKAFTRMPNRKLIVIGSGPESDRVLEAARGHSNIQVLGYQTDDALCRYIAKARAFLFAAIEDFGIAPLEAQACGTPVIALARGATLETIRDLKLENPTGVYFFEQSEDSIIEAVEIFESRGHAITPQNCRKNAERFAVERFRMALTDLVSEAVTSTSTLYPMSFQSETSSRNDVPVDFKQSGDIA